MEKLNTDTEIEISRFQRVLAILSATAGDFVVAENLYQEVQQAHEAAVADYVSKKDKEIDSWIERISIIKRSIQEAQSRDDHAAVVKLDKELRQAERRLKRVTDNLESYLLTANRSTAAYAYVLSAYRNGRLPEAGAHFNGK
jgi:vacuolar-type H+-ATPase subunit I/STV1